METEREKSEREYGTSERKRNLEAELERNKQKER